VPISGKEGGDATATMRRTTAGRGQWWTGRPAVQERITSCERKRAPPGRSIHLYVKVTDLRPDRSYHTATGGRTRKTGIRTDPAPLVATSLSECEGPNRFGPDETRTPYRPTGHQMGRGNRRCDTFRDERCALRHCGSSISARFVDSPHGRHTVIPPCERETRRVMSKE